MGDYSKVFWYAEWCLAAVAVAGGILLAILEQGTWAAILLVLVGVLFAGFHYRRTVMLRAMAEQLMRTKEEADLALRSRTAFLASITHDFRAPLNNVLLLASMLERALGDELGGKQRKRLRDISLNCRHVMDMVNDLLDLAKIEAAQLELRIVTVDLLAVIDSAFRLVYDRAAAKGLAVEQPEEEYEIFVRADELRLKQALVNLLVNAVKFTPEGGRIGVHIRSEPERHEVAVSVWDTGVGIEPEAQARIFEPFEQARAPVGTDSDPFPGGTGLGLALVKRIVEQHGGRVDVASEPELGSSFTIHLKQATKSSSRRRRASSSGFLPPVSEGMLR